MGAADPPPSLLEMVTCLCNTGIVGNSRLRICAYTGNDVLGWLSIVVWLNSCYPTSGSDSMQHGKVSLTNFIKLPRSKGTKCSCKITLCTCACAKG